MKTGYYVIKDPEGDLSVGLYVEHRLPSMPHIVMKDWLIIGEKDLVPNGVEKITPLQFLGEELDELVTRERKYFKNSRLK